MSYVYQLPYLDARSGQTTSGQQTNPITAIFSADGTKMILAGATNLPPNGTGDGTVGSNTLYQYTLSTAFDLSTASPTYPNLPSGDSAQNYSGVENYRSIIFGDSGNKIFAVGKGGIIITNDNLVAMSAGSPSGDTSFSFRDVPESSPNA